MKQKPNLPRRRAMRLRGYDYRQPGAYFVRIQPGAYFVRICVQHRKCLFGAIIAGHLQLNEIGQIVIECWSRVPQHFPSVELDEYVIMPNHMHGIIALNIVGARSLHPADIVGTRSPRPSQTVRHRRDAVPSPTLGQIVAYFKYQSTKHINQHHNMPGTRIWQRNYYEHVIRDDIDLQRLRRYIQNNPMKWTLDQWHPDNPSKW